MKAIDIIKNNQNELDAENFTTLLTAIDPRNSEEQLELAKVLSMLQEAGVEPFDQYKGPYTFRQIVQLGCEVFDPEKFTTGLLITDAYYENVWKPPTEMYLKFLDCLLFRSLSISIMDQKCIILSTLLKMVE